MRGMTIILVSILDLSLNLEERIALETRFTAAWTTVELVSLDI